MTEYITMTTLCLRYLAAYSRNAAYKYVKSNLDRHNRLYAPLHRWLYSFWFLTMAPGTTDKVIGSIEVISVIYYYA